MINVQRLDATNERDRAVIQETVTHPAIYRHIVDDSAPKREQFSYPADNSMIALAAKDDDELLGLFGVVPHGEVCEIHVCMLPKAWGARSLEAARHAFAWIWDNLGVKAIIAGIPEYNRLALRLSKRVGMVNYGVNPRSWRHDGKRYDMILLAIGREEAQCLS